MPADFAYTVIDKCPYAVLTMIDTQGKPYAVPLSIARADAVIYFHSAMQGEKTDILRQNPEVCLVGVDNVNPLPKEFSTEYESAIIRGRAAEVTDKEEKILALRLICERYIPENMAEFEQMVAKSLERTAIWRIDVEDITGKRKIAPK